MGTTERVVQYLELKGISKYKFCKDLDFSNKFLDNSSNMGTDKACKILQHYPEINPEWLLTGIGSMLKIGVQKEAPPPPEAHNTGALDQLRKENAMQALLIASQTKTIAGLEFQVATLEKELSTLKQAPKDPIFYNNVAEPAPELSK